MQHVSAAARVRGGQPTSTRPPSHRTPLAAAAVAGLAAALLAGCAGDDGTSAGSDGVTAPALWYGTTSNGTHVSGVTEVSITARATGNGQPFSVDLSGLSDDGTDEAWNATAWSAAAQGMLISGLDPRGRSLAFDVRESIGGPSAGAMLAAASAVTLAGGSLARGVAVTGTVLPDGGVGAVSGIPDKLRGAQDSGLTTVMIPAGRATGIDQASGETVDLVAYGQSLGLSITPVASVQEALTAVRRDVPPRAESTPPPLAPELVALAAGAAQASLDRLATGFTAVRPAPAGLPAERATALEAALAQARERVPALLAGGDVFGALVLAGTTERAIVAWNAGAGAAADADSAGVPAAAASVVAEAERVEAAAIGRREAAAASPTPTVESQVSLPDALSWATDAVTTARVTADAVRDVPQTSASLAGHAADLAQVDYDTRIYLPLAVAAATTAPGTPAPTAAAEAAPARPSTPAPTAAAAASPAGPSAPAPGNAPTPEPDPLARLDAYADLLAQAAEAAAAYFRSMSEALRADPELPDSRLTQALAQQWRERPAGPSQAAAMTRASIAMAYYVSSTSLVAGAGAFAADTRAQDPATRIVTADPQTFAQQVTTAQAAADLQSRYLAGAALSPQYLLWCRDWGLTQARAEPNGAVSAQTRREGLVYLWYATTSGRMLPTTPG